MEGKGQLMGDKVRKGKFKRKITERRKKSNLDIGKRSNVRREKGLIKGLKGKKR